MKRIVLLVIVATLLAAMFPFARVAQAAPAAVRVEAPRASAAGQTTGSGRIAFNRGTGSIFVGNIYVMNADGTGQTPLTSTGLDFQPAWSPDGKRMAFASSRDGNQEIYVMNADGTGQTRLTNNTANDKWPAWSPDGSRIAFTSERDGNMEIYVMNTDGAAQTRLTNNPGWDRAPTWSPDGSRIAFASSRDGNGEIYVMKADGSGQTRLTNNSVFDDDPAWSPDGRKIAFMSEMDIYVMNADGTGRTRLTNLLGWGFMPAWSPEGKRIAFMTDEEIYVMNADGTGQTRLTNNPAYDSHPAWFPLPDEVWVDDDWAGRSFGDIVFGHTFGVDAFAKVQDGVNRVASPGTVHVAQGTYRENVVIRGGPVVDKTVRLLGGYSSATWARDSSVYISTINGGGVGKAIDVLMGDGAVIDGFAITGGSVGISFVDSDGIAATNNNVWGNAGHGIYADDVRGLSIENNRIHDNSTAAVALYLVWSAIIRDNELRGNGSGVFVLYGNTATIAGNTIRDNRGWGVRGATESSADITGNRITGNTTNGVEGFDQGASVIRNTILDNGGWGIDRSPGGFEIVNNVIARNARGGINASKYNTIVNNTIVYNKGGGGISWVPGSMGTVVNSIIWQNAPFDLPAGLTVTYSDITNPYPGIGNISADPQFVDPAAGNYHLKFSSPCIDKGTNTGGPADDLEGILRPVDGNIDGTDITDMGAYEYVPLRPVEYRFASRSVSYPYLTVWMNVKMENSSNALIHDVSANVVSWPPYARVPDAGVWFGDIPGGSARWSFSTPAQPSGATFSLVTDMRIVDSHSRIYWNIAYTDGLGRPHVLKNVPQ